MAVDIERLVSIYERSDDGVTDIVEQRVYTEIPARPTFPLLRMTLIGGSPIFSRPLHLDAPIIQFDAYGGPKVQARALADAVRASLGDDFLGTHDFGAEEGDLTAVVTGVDFGELAYVPDTEYDPAKPRYTFEVTIYTHP